jgi:hypothetical protein
MAFHRIPTANFLFFKRIAGILLRSPVSLHRKSSTAALEMPVKRSYIAGIRRF